MAGGGEGRKRDAKADSKHGDPEVSDIEGGDETKSEVRLYPVFKQSNSMNNMLPSVKSAREEAIAISEAKAKEIDPEEPAKKRAKIDGIKKMLEVQTE